MRNRLRLALVIAVLGIAIAVPTVASTAANPSSSGPSSAVIARHQAARHHVLEVLHARRVHARALRGAAEMAALGAPGSWRDWYRVDTPDWLCIKVGEGGGSYDHWSGAWGFEPGTAAAFGLPYPMNGVPHGQQDSAALLEFRSYGWSPWSTAAGCGL